MIENIFKHKTEKITPEKSGWNSIYLHLFWQILRNGFSINCSAGHVGWCKKMQRCKSKRSTSAWSESEDEMTRSWWRQGELTTSGDRSDARRKNILWWRIILFILLRACIFVDFNAWPVSAWLHHQRQIHSCKSTDRKMVNKYFHRRFWNEKLRKVCILFIFLGTLPYIISILFL